MIEPRIDVFDLVMSISSAIDLVDPKLVDHHVRVAYIGASLSRAGYLSRKQENDILIAAMLHDIGAMRKNERLEFLQFAPTNPHKHSEIGYQLLKDFDLFEDPARVIRFHHVSWRDGRGARFFDEEVPIESHVIHLADRVSVILNDDLDVIQQRRLAVEKIEAACPRMFHPRAVSWFKRLAQKDEFWLDLRSPHLGTILRRRVKRYEIELTYDILIAFAHLLSQLVDFQSRFTSTHSSGVSAAAEHLARLIGFSERECQKIMVAGFLHDIGKLAIPTEILEKPAKLDEGEFQEIKSHSYHTSRILEPVRGIDEIVNWCAMHHEKLNGEGYPFREVGGNIPLAATILSAADIFTALTEDRPYREGMTRERVRMVFEEMVGRGELDNRIIKVLLDNYDEINWRRQSTQDHATRLYQEFKERIRAFCDWTEAEEAAWATGRPSPTAPDQAEIPGV